MTTRRLRSELIPLVDLRTPPSSASPASTSWSCARTNLRPVRSKLPSAERFDKGIKRIDTLGGPQNVSVISESGLYRLIMRSKLPSAERFEKGMKRIPTLGGPQNISSRVIEIDGEPWFVAPDALNAMGYTQGNYASIRRKLGEKREGCETNPHPWRTSERQRNQRERPLKNHHALGQT